MLIRARDSTCVNAWTVGNPRDRLSGFCNPGKDVNLFVSRFGKEQSADLSDVRWCGYTAFNTFDICRTHQLFDNNISQAENKFTRLNYVMPNVFSI